jgi:diaminohydroxyphosphoribosylaminopyrimidine deaminase/5-amino-6-(5-phosphoribosylamino)uracil reductase
MAEALALAERGAGRVAPNPLVGCVIVKDGKIVGRGWHEGAGLPHAEVVALKDAGAAARGAAVYVTLEPCNHTGRTPPCTEALIAAGVSKVIFAHVDPTPIAAGGARRLQKAGIEIGPSVLTAEAQTQNRFYLHRIKTRRPYVIAKFAASLDGKLATHRGDSQWITGFAARRRAHELRRQVDAIAVGADTILADDPALTGRLDDAPTHYPLRIALDSTGRTSPGSKIYDRTGGAALIAVTDAAPRARLDAFREHGVEILPLPPDENGRPDLDALLDALGARGVNGLLAEGGGATLGAFFDCGLVNEVWAFIAPLIIGGADAPSVDGRGVGLIDHAHRLQDVAIERLDGDILVRGRIRRPGAQR